MGKKQPVAAARKQRPGADITRFLEPRTCPADAGTRHAVSKGGRHIAGIQTATERTSTPRKHLLDNVLLSQDADDGGMHVVWASSPAAVLSPQKGGLSQEALSTSQPPENSQTSKEGFRKTLIQAVQRGPSDSDQLLTDQHTAGSGGGVLLEQLLARRGSHRAASTSAPGRPAAQQEAPAAGHARAGAPMPSSRGQYSSLSVLGRTTVRRSVDVDDDQVMQDVLASTEPYKTPANARPAATVLTSQSGDGGRSSHCTPSALTVGGRRTLSQSGKKTVSGHKRRALLDLLDQVNLVFKHRPSNAENLEVPPQPQLDAATAHNSSAAAVTSDSKQQGVEVVGPAVAAPDLRPSVEQCCSLEPSTIGETLPSMTLGTPGPQATPVGAAGCPATQPIGQDWDAATASASHHSGITAPGSLRRTPHLQDLGYAMPPPAVASALHTTPAAAPSLQSAGTAATPFQRSRGRPSAQYYEPPVRGFDPAMDEAERCGRPPPAPLSGAAPPQGQWQGPVGPHQVPCAGRPLPERREDAMSTPGGCGDGVQVVRPPAALERPPGVPPLCVPHSTVVDDDDDDVWGDVDIDALVAHVTSREKSPVQEGPISVTAVTGLHTSAAATGCPGAVNASQVPTPQLQQQQRHNPGVHPADRQPLQPIQTVPQPAVPVVKAPDGLPVQGKADASHAAAAPLLGDREAVHLVVLEVDHPPADHFKVLRCFNEYKGMEVRVCLRDMWVDQQVEPGDTVNVVGGRSLPDPTCTTFEVTANEGLLIVHPDVLLSGTSVCSAIRCTRQAWLQERVASGPSGEKALLGSMMHELLQRSLRAALAGKLNRDEMMAEARSILSANTDKLLECQQDEISALSYLSHQLDALLAWCKTYVAPNPTAPLGGRIDALGNGPPTYCRVNEVVDIEESIWAPKYGLKGQLDASLRVSMTKDPLHNQRTLTGGYASSMQQQRMMQQQQQGHMQSGAVFHGRRQENMRQGGGQRTPEVPGVARSGKDMSHPSMWQQHQQHWSAGVVAPGAGGVANQFGAQYAGQRGGPALPGDVTAEIIVPFEFKTGKDSHEHRAQVLLYLLLMEDRYHTAIKTGLLWNSNKPVMQAVHYAHHELASLVMHRNRLAAYLVGAARTPPPPLKEPESDRKCNYCSVSATCALYLAASAHGDGRWGGDAMAKVQQQAAELSPVLREKLDMISPASAAFFAHWIRLVDAEELAARGNRSHIWAISGAQREQQGGCIADLIFERELHEQQDPDGKRFLYVFKRPLAAARGGGGGGAASGHSGTGGEASLRATRVTSCDGQEGEEERDSGAGAGLLVAGFTPGDMGLLGVEGRHAAVSRVTVVEVTKNTITLSTRKELKVNKLSGPTPPLAGPGCQGLEPPGRRPVTHPSGSNASCLTWRLDRDESATVFSQMRLNLALLGVPGAASGWQSGCRNGGNGDATEARREGQLMRLRKLIIDLEPPLQGFARHDCGSELTDTGSIGSSQEEPENPYLREAAHAMNNEQLVAVDRVLGMQDFAMLLGMPGTGKTTTIVHIIRALVEQHGGCTVLVAAYTNSAVDNILLKLVGTPVSFVRVGSAAAVHPGIRPYMPGGAAHPDTSVQGLRDTMARVNVVGTTCLSVHSPLLAGRSFGVCILDEASQVTLPASIGALTLARSFLLVGDHYQLSPLVVSKEAEQGGLGVSLFRRLSEAHPQAVITLRNQYRMAADIMALSNSLVYNSGMVCGNEAVANASLRLPHLAALYSYEPATAALGSPRSAWPAGLTVPSWLLQVLQPEARVMFLDTDGAAGCRELTLRDGLVNPGEVRLVRAMAAALMAAGLPAGDIGVASPYRAQVAALQGALADLDGATGVLGGQAAATTASKATMEVLTVDKYQGRDKPAILLSFVRCNTHRNAGRLLNDWQRLNVALTRARTKLLLVGSAETLASIPITRSLLALLRRNGWLVRLPVDCLSALPQVQNAAS